MHNLSMLTFPSANTITTTTTTCSTPPQTTGMISAIPESQQSSLDAKTQLTDFSQILQILRARFRCMTSFTSPGHTFYFDISEWHILPAHAWTPALMLHLTNPCVRPLYYIRSLLGQSWIHSDYIFHFILHVLSIENIFCNFQMSHIISEVIILKL